MKSIIFILLSLTVLSCQNLKYQSDIGFLNSAQANSAEYLVMINGKHCVDMDRKVGLCAKRIKSDRSLDFSLEPKPYNYRFTLTCSSSIDSNFSIDIIKNQKYSFSIEPDKFSNVRSFTCIGEIFPNDRDQEVSANFQVRVVIVDSEYIEREIIYEKPKKRKNYVILGKHAKYSNVNGKIYKEKTAVKVDSRRIKAYSESERMRFNYYGY